MSSSEKLVCFAHGKESGPWGKKIKYLAAIAQDCSFDVLSPDFRGENDPNQRIQILTDALHGFDGHLVLVGSSMGGYVVAHSAARLAARQLILMAPALYFPGFDDEPPKCDAETYVIHGWNDAVVPVESAIRYARTHRARLHVVSSDHMLHDQLELIGGVLRKMLLPSGNSNA